MKSIDEAIFEFARDSANIEALVGDKIFLDFVPPEAVRPYITRQRVANTHVHNLVNASGMSRPTIQFDIWADDDESRINVAEAVRNRFDGFVGNMAGVAVQLFEMVGEEDLFESPRDNSNIGIYRRRQDYDIAHTESVPSFL